MVYFHTQCLNRSFDGLQIWSGATTIIKYKINSERNSSLMCKQKAE